jgi:DNA-binding beta-propeller fold protein YncE
MKPVGAIFLSIFAASVVAACGGGGASIPASPANGTFAPQRTKHRTGKAHIRIRIPHKKRRGRHSHYISDSTKSIGITIAGFGTTIANLRPSSPGCSTVAGATQCSVSVTVPYGSAAYAFVTYDGLNATGNKLSANDATFDVVPGQTTQLGVVLGGITKSILVTPPTTPAVTGSQTAGFQLYGRLAHAFTFMALDADGNDIIGAGAPAVSMTAPPVAQHLGIATPAPATPNQWTFISSYKAQDPTVPRDAVVTAVVTPVPGSGAAVVSTAVHVAQYEPWIYVTDLTGNTLYVFDEQGNEIDLGSSAWVGIPSPSGLTYDPNNKQLYTAGQGDGIVYQTNVTGTLVSPAPGAWSNLAEPSGALYVTSNHHIYVSNTVAPTPSAPPPAGVVAFDENGTQQALGNEIATQVAGGLAFDPVNGFIYTANYSQSSRVSAFDTNGALQTLSGGFPGIDGAYALAYDSNSGNMYVGNVEYSSGDVLVFDANGTPVTTTGTFSGLSYPSGLVYDPYDGLIYVADGGGEDVPSTVHVYDEQGVTQPITFNETFSQAYGITVVP